MSGDLDDLDDPRVPDLLEDHGPVVGADQAHGLGVAQSLLQGGVFPRGVDRARLQGNRGSAPHLQREGLFSFFMLHAMA